LITEWTYFFQITDKTYLDGSDFNGDLIAVTQIHSHLLLLGVRISGDWVGVDVPLAKRKKVKSLILKANEMHYFTNLFR